MGGVYQIEPYNDKYGTDSFLFVGSLVCVILQFCTILACCYFMRYAKKYDLYVYSGLGEVAGFSFSLAVVWSIAANGTFSRQNMLGTLFDLYCMCGISWVVEFSYTLVAAESRRAFHKKKEVTTGTWLQKRLKYMVVSICFIYVPCMTMTLYTREIKSLHMNVLWSSVWGGGASVMFLSSIQKIIQVAEAAKKGSAELYKPLLYLSYLFLVSLYGCLVLVYLFVVFQEDVRWTRDMMAVVAQFVGVPMVLGWLYNEHRKKTKTDQERERKKKMLFYNDTSASTTLNNNSNSKVSRTSLMKSIVKPGAVKVAPAPGDASSPQQDSKEEMQAPV